MSDNVPSLIPYLAAMATHGNDDENLHLRVCPATEGEYAVDELEPPSALEGETPVRSLWANFTGDGQRQLQVTKYSTRGEIAYTAEISPREPHMIFFMPNEPQAPLGTAIIHTRLSKIDITMYGRDIKMCEKTRLKKVATYESPAMNNAVMTWQSRTAIKLLDFELRDTNSTLLAQFNPGSFWSLKKIGRLDFFGLAGHDRSVMEEVLVTGLVLVHATSIQLATNAVSAAAGGSSRD